MKISEEMVNYMKSNSPYAMTAIRGVFSEFKCWKKLRSLRYIKNLEGNHDNTGLPDFQYTFNGKIIRHEHKVRSTAYVYKNGDVKLDIRRSRVPLGCTSKSILYDNDEFDILSIDMSPNREEEKTFFFISVKDLEKDPRYPNKIRRTQRISSSDRRFKSSLKTAIKRHLSEEDGE